MESNSYIAQNIKFLRKRDGLSQEHLAQKLNIKRANIAAYESKGVEPRLRILMEIAKLFNVQFEEFLSQPLSEGSKIGSYTKQDTAQLDISPNDIDPVVFKEFAETSSNVRKVLEGFKAYNNLTKTETKEDINASKLRQDLKNFTSLLERLLNRNEAFINTLVKGQSKFKNV